MTAPRDIRVVTPAPPGSRSGNRVTALRWARLLRELGHRVRVQQSFEGGRADLLLALHAVRSAPSIERFRAATGGRCPVLLALTGTDLYGELAAEPTALRSIEAADRLILLQPLGVEALPEAHRWKARVIRQSAALPRPEGKGAFAGRHRANGFEVCVCGHLREVKDPFRAAEAARRLPPESRIRIVHLGRALDPELERRAREEMAANPRYRWLGERPHAETLRRLARSRLLVLSSRLEGGANVLSEAVAAGTPVLASRIPGSVGLLGEEYPGYFPPGDTEALAQLLLRAETEPEFYGALQEACARLAPEFQPERERKAWRELLAELWPSG